jgi:hypothetical protein
LDLSFFFEVRNFVEFGDLQGLGERSRVDLRLWLDSIDNKELRLVSLRIKDGDDEDRE